MASRSFHVTTHQLHLKWSSTVAPVLTVPSGSEVTFDLKDGGNNQIRPDNAAAGTAIRDFDLAKADPAFGPVYVEGAEPGDVLRVDILELTPGPYGWTAVFPGFGLLADEFPEPHLHMWDLSSDGSSSSSNATTTTSPQGHRRAVFAPGISVPIRPFLGIVGVAPAQGAPDLGMIPPRAAIGGNMDTRDLRAGTALFMPVRVPGALLSCGDGHAAQGDGEVCGTAIETPMRARLRLTVEKKKNKGGGGGPERKWEMRSPHLVTAPRSEGDAPPEADGGEYAALGIHEDPTEAARMALRGVLDWLVGEKGLSRADAYMLASVAASLRMTQVVDMPTYTIACSIPLNTFS